jgi:serralysin
VDGSTTASSGKGKMTGSFTSVKDVSLTGNTLIDGVLSGYAWAGPITYAFPTSAGSYSYSGEPASFGAVSSAQIGAALFALEASYGTVANNGFSVEGFTSLSISFGHMATAALRFGESDQPSTAWAYLPGEYAQAGDVWFGRQDDYRAATPGNYEWHAMLHEIGHALGLKHGHEADGDFAALPARYDSLEYTIMTYRGYVGGGLGYYYDGADAPQSYMIADLAGLQHMYGANYNTNSGNNLYSWRPGSGATLVDGDPAISPTGTKIFATIWDGGGIDTFDLAAYSTSLHVDLRPGEASLFSVDQAAHLGGDMNGGYARGNIYNPLLYKGNTASLIENVKGGSAADSITGNQADNMLWGNAGSDNLSGGSGNDTMIGGAGTDVLNGGSGNDTFVLDAEHDRIIDNAGVDVITSTIARSLVDYSSVEDLKLLGNGNINGTGNALNNVLTGNVGSNGLVGNAGKDSLFGGGGNDKLYGGTGDDGVYGNDGNDYIDGGAGSDRLSGGAGSDTFFFGAALSGRTNIDVITDFTNNRQQNDVIWLDNAVFTKFASNGSIAKGNFMSSAVGVAKDSNDHLLYNSSNGNLYYDVDGSGAGGATLFAQFSNVAALTYHDFLIA